MSEVEALALFWAVWKVTADMCWEKTGDYGEPAHWKRLGMACEQMDMRIHVMSTIRSIIEKTLRKYYHVDFHEHAVAKQAEAAAKRHAPRKKRTKITE